MHIVLLVHDLHFILVVYYTNQSDNILLSTTFLADGQCFFFFYLFTILRRRKIGETKKNGDGAFMVSSSVTDTESGLLRDKHWILGPSFVDLKSLATM